MEVTEIVGRFAGQGEFTGAVEDLLEAGFASSDLSVLDTHESLSVAGTPGQAWRNLLTSSDRIAQPCLAPSILLGRR